MIEFIASLMLCILCGFFWFAFCAVCFAVIFLVVGFIQAWLIYNRECRLLLKQHKEDLNG